MSDKKSKMLYAEEVDEILENNRSYDDLIMTYGKSNDKKLQKKLCVKQVKNEEVMIVAESKIEQLNNAIIQNDKKKIENSVTKLGGNLLKYLDKDIHIIIDANGSFYFRGKDICVILGYKNTKEAISYHVDEIYKKIYLDFLKVENSTLEKPKGNTGKTIYINKEGMFNLILNSNAKCALDFKKYISGVLVKIDDGEDIYEEDVKTSETIFVKHENPYEPYVKHNSAFDVKDENTLYLAEIGVVDTVGYDTNVNKNERIFKLGITDRGLQRHGEHQKNIDDFVTFYYVKYIYNKKLEDALKYELKCKGMSRFCRLNNGVKYTELFTVDENFGIDDVKCFIENYIAKNDPLKECSGEYLLEIEREKTRQSHEITLQMQEMTKKEEAIANQKKYEYEMLKLKYDKKSTRNKNA